MCRDKKKFQSFADWFDAFSQAPPNMTIKGREEIHSSMGLFASLILFSAVIGFSVYRCSQIITKSNPSSFSVDLKDQHGSEAEGINYSDILQFKAISVTSARDGLVKHDPRYIDFEVTVWEGKGNAQRKVHTSGMHRCTDDEFKKMHPPRKQTSYAFEEIKK